jgi:hypothetical protein
MPYPVSASPQFYVCTRHLNIVPVQHIYTPDLSFVFPLSLIINYDHLHSLRLISCPLLCLKPPPTFSEIRHQRYYEGAAHKLKPRLTS